MQRTPERGDLWKHKNGCEFEVLHLANTAYIDRYNPPTVVYWQRLNEYVYTRPLSQWHELMEFVMDGQTRKQLSLQSDKRVMEQARVIEQWTEHEGFVTGMVDGVATHVVGVIALDRTANMLYAKSGEFKLGAECDA